MEENLDQLESQLLASLAEVQRKKDERAKVIKEQQEREKNRKSIIILAINHDTKLIEVKNDYRLDIVTLLQHTAGRINKSFGISLIPFDSWKEFQSKLLGLDNILISYKEPGLAIELDKLNEVADWTITKLEREIKLDATGKNAKPYQILYGSIPGGEYRPHLKAYTIPLAEAWRLVDYFEKNYPTLKIEYDNGTLEYIQRIYENRKRIDEIAIAKDWDWDVEFVDKSVKLRPVQRVGGAFLEATNGKALLAFQMGLGKTIISLAYAMKHNLKTLIVCPATLKPNWVREVKRLTGINPQVLIGTEPGMFDVKQLMFDKPQYVICNYDTISNKSVYTEVVKKSYGDVHEEKTKYLWSQVLSMVGFDLLIVDESHYIKNVDSNRSQAVRALKIPKVIHMTGTPVLNRPGELWPMLTMIDHETFPSEDTFLRQYTYDRKMARNVEELRTLLKPIMIRRKQEDIMDEVPELHRNTEYHELSKKALKIYNKILEGIYLEMQEYDAQKADFAHLGQTYYEQRKTAHILAKIQRLKQVCAIDKADRTAELAQELSDSASESKHKKVIIFSQYKAVAYAIWRRLADDGAICFVERTSKDFVTVDIKKRDELVQQFQNDPKVKYLIVTEKTAREGHTMTQAGYVIFNDLFWTPANHEQAEGRAYMRINDPHGIDSYYMIADMQGDSIEEWIWELLQLKSAVIAETVEGIEASRDISVANELIKRLRETMFTLKKSK